MQTGRARSRRWWLLPAVAVTITLLALAGVWLVWHYYHRVGQIPLSGEPFDVSAFLAERVSPDENAADVYRQAIQAAMPLLTAEIDGRPLVPRLNDFAALAFLDFTEPLADEDAFVEFSTEAFQLARQAAQMPRAMFADPAEVDPQQGTVELSDLRGLCSILHMQQSVGTGIEGDGQLGLQKWVGNPGISLELAQRAFRDFQSLRPEPPSPACVPKLNYIWVRRDLSQSPDAIMRLMAQRKPQMLGPGRQSPLSGPFAGWELERARRLVPLLIANHLAASELEPWQRPARIEPQIVGRHQFFGPPPLRMRIWVTLFPDADRLARWLDDTPLLKMLGPFYGPEVGDMAAVRRRATALILALRAYQSEHGAYPASLAELQGQYFDKLPTDPYSATIIYGHGSGRLGGG